MITVEKYFADWCQPCKLLTPVMDELKNIYVPKGVIFTEVDMEKQPELGQQHGIRSLPTIVIFRNGVEFGRMVGLHHIKKYKDAIDGVLDT